MKNTLRYILAIPAGIIASLILPTFFMWILKLFIPFDFITNFMENYLLPVFAGWVAVGFTIIIVPKRQFLFGVIMLLLNIIGSTYMYYAGEDFNYLFLIGGLIPLGIVYLSTKEVNPT